MTATTIVTEAQEHEKSRAATLSSVAEPAVTPTNKPDHKESQQAAAVLKWPKWWLLNFAIILVSIISLFAFLLSHKAKPTASSIVKPVSTQLAESSHQQPKLASSIAQANTNALLTDLQTKLAMIEQTLASQGNTQVLTQQYQYLQHLDQTLMSDEENNRSTVTASLDKDSQTILTQLDQLQAHLVALTNVLQKDHITYLKAGALPFKVLAIDMIQQQPVITLFYANDSFPISLNESVAGWELIAADYTKQVAEFKNAQNQQVKIELHTEQGE